MPFVAIFEPDSEDEDAVGTLVVGDRNDPDHARTVGPMTRGEAERLAREHGFDFEIVR